MLGGFLLLRRAMLDELGGLDEGFRLYGEDIDLAYRAMRAGWERWYVPAAVVRHEHQAETDRRWLTRRTLWHWAGIVRFVAKHPESAASPAMSDAPRSSTASPRATPRGRTPIRRRYARGRAELVASLGPRLYPVRRGARPRLRRRAHGAAARGARPALPRRRRQRGDDRRGAPDPRRARSRSRSRRWRRTSRPSRSTATLILNAIGYPDDRVAFLRHVAGYTTKKVVFDFNPRAHDAAEIERDLRLAGLQLAARRGYLVPQSFRLPGPVAAGLRRLEPRRRGRVARAAAARAVALRGGAVPRCEPAREVRPARAAATRTHDYADPVALHGPAGRGRDRARARRSPPGATVLDLPCGDANMAEPLLALGYRYRGVDGSAAMIEEARARLGERVPLDVALMDEYEPAEPVDMTLCLRAFYYAADRRAFFRRVAGYTRTKFVFDFDPRTYDARRDRARPARERLRRARCCSRSSCRSSTPCPAPVRGALRRSSSTGPLARAALRVRGIWFVRGYSLRAGRNLKPTCAPSWRGSLSLARNVGAM